jgi:hypothetical protein
MRQPKIKVPFDLAPGVTPSAQVVLPKVSDLALSSTGVLAIASANSTSFVDKDGVRLEARGTLSSTPARYVMWSDDGSRIATLDTWRNDQAAHLVVHDWSTGELLATGSVPNWGTVSHGTPGVGAPLMTFGADARRVYLRSTTMHPMRGSAIGVLDVATGTFEHHALEGDDYVFSIAFSKGRLFALYSSMGNQGGLMSLDATTLAKQGHFRDVRGECLVPGEPAMWIVGDRRYVWRVAGEAKESPGVAWERARELRWARHQHLASRARSKWDKNELERLEAQDEEWSPPDEASEPGVQQLMHPEPWMIPQAARIGGDDIIVRDGVCVSRWSVRDGQLEVTPLVDDPKRATPSKARLLMLSAQGNHFVLGWQKAFNADDTYCTVFDV